MIFDSLYRTCEATVQEGEQHICSYEASEISVHDRGTTPECFQGDYRIAYRTEETDTVIELYDIDCIVEEDSSGSRKKYYYCGIKWNGETLIPVPSREERKIPEFPWNVQDGDRMDAASDGSVLMNTLRIRPVLKRSCIYIPSPFLVLREVL